LLKKTSSETSSKRSNCNLVIIITLLSHTTHSYKYFFLLNNFPNLNKNGLQLLNKLQLLNQLLFHVLQVNIWSFLYL